MCPTSIRIIHEPSAQIFSGSTITYDTLVRAGVKCTSVFVPAEGNTLEDGTKQAVATCSRGVRIISDTTLDEVLKSDAVRFGCPFSDQL